MYVALKMNHKAREETLRNLRLIDNGVFTGRNLSTSNKDAILFISQKMQMNYEGTNVIWPNKSHNHKIQMVGCQSL